MTRVSKGRTQEGNGNENAIAMRRKAEEMKDATLVRGGVARRELGSGSERERERECVV